MRFQYRKKKSYVLTHFYERMDWLGQGKLALYIDHFSAEGWTETRWKLAVLSSPCGHHPHELLAELGAGPIATLDYRGEACELTAARKGTQYRYIRGVPVFLILGLLLS